jgi:hypothetical protein
MYDNRIFLINKKFKKRQTHLNRRPTGTSKTYNQRSYILNYGEDHAHHVFRHPRDCSSRIRPPGPDRQHRVLLRSSVAFEGEHSAKAIGFVAREELDSP